MTSTRSDVRGSSPARPWPNRRPRRRSGGVLVLFALASFALAAGCIAGLDAAGRLPEGMLSLALVMMAVMLVVTGCALLAVGLVLLLRPGRAPASWQVARDDPGLVRWWDGRAWTEHTAPRSVETQALAPLVSSSRRRRAIGAALLVGGLVVAVVCDQVAQATVVPATSPYGSTGSVWIVAQQLVVPGLLAAVLGLFLVLTLTDDVRPGWQPDPSDAEALRWWDGSAWTDATTPRSRSAG